MRQLVAGQTMADIALMPDSYRATPPGAWSSSLHFVNVPPSAHEVSYVEDCVGGCALQAIYNYTDILYKRRNSIRTCCSAASRAALLPPLTHLRHCAAAYPLCNASNPTEVEPCPLSFLTHFMGDAHQPMHICFSIDRGGNSFVVSWYGNCTNLHSTWDSKIIIKYLNGARWPTLANELITTLRNHPAVVSRWTRDLSAVSWMNESLSMCRMLAYNFEPGFYPITPRAFSAEQLYFDTFQERVLFSATGSDQSCNQTTQLVAHAKSSGAGAFDALHGILTGEFGDHDDAWLDAIRSVPSRNRPSARAANANTCAGPLLSDAYYCRNIWRVKQRLSMAGVRLAAILNSVYAHK